MAEKGEVAVAVGSRNGVRTRRKGRARDKRARKVTQSQNGQEKGGFLQVRGEFLYSRVLTSFVDSIKRKVC
jgi:hypothetical protein